MPAMSKPSPFRTDRAIGWTAPLGWLPALQARKRPSPSLFMMASPRIERALLPVHRKSSRSEEHTSELQSLMRISYAVFGLKKKTKEATRDYNNAIVITHIYN